MSRSLIVPCIKKPRGTHNSNISLDYLFIQSHKIKQLTQKYFLSLLLIIFTSNNCYALKQDAKQWFAASLTRPLDNEKRWLGLLYSQFRFIDNSHPWQSVLAEGGLGYQYLSDKSIWLGYRWTGQNPYNGFSIENRIFEQIIWKIVPAGRYRLVTRSRLEETLRSHEDEISIRFRQRLALEINRDRLSPFFYEEVFFQLNNTQYTPHYFFGQNRLFLGFNFMQKNNTWWEIGYINQFQMRTPHNNANQMSHIISVTYLF